MLSPWLLCGVISLGFAAMFIDEIVHWALRAGEALTKPRPPKEKRKRKPKVVDL